MSDAPERISLRGFSYCDGKLCGTVADFSPDLDEYIRADLYEALQARVEELEAALKAVRDEICTGPVDDVLWHRGCPAETTVDFICNILGDDWNYDDWSIQNDTNGTS